MIHNPRVPPIPESYAEVLEVFGNIHNYIRKDGTLDPKWEREQIARILIPQPTPLAWAPKTLVSQITVHRKLAWLSEKMFREIYGNGLWPKLGPYGGGFNFRPIRGASKMSLHSFGIAWDFDPVGFPLGSPKKRDKALAELIRSFGFKLGEDFKGRKDAQHFQYAVNT